MARIELYTVEYDTDIKRTVGVLNTAAIKAMGENNFRRELLQALVASIGVHITHLFNDTEAKQFIKQVIPLIEDARRKERNMLSANKKE